MESMTHDISCSRLHKGNLSILEYINTTEQKTHVSLLLLKSLEIQCIRNQMSDSILVDFLVCVGACVHVHLSPPWQNITNFRIKLNRLHFSSTSSISIYSFLKIQQNPLIDHRDLFFLKTPQQSIYKPNRMKC